MRKSKFLLLYINYSILFHLFLGNCIFNNNGRVALKTSILTIRPRDPRTFGSRIDTISFCVLCNRDVITSKT